MIAFSIAIGSNDSVESQEFALMFYVRYVCVQHTASALFPRLETMVQLRLVPITLKLMFAISDTAATLVMAN